MAAPDPNLVPLLRDATSVVDSPMPGNVIVDDILNFGDVLEVFCPKSVCLDD